MTQEPVVHVAVALARLHGTPHAPQLDNVVSGASQPLTGFPSQLRKLGLQTGVQVPAAQEVVPLALVQTRPHEPQLATLVCVLRQTLLQQEPLRHWEPTVQLPPSLARHSPEATWQPKPGAQFAFEAQEVRHEPVPESHA